ncbi:MAG: isoprenyl transferase [Pseudomonadota bacterium]
MLNPDPLSNVDAPGHVAIIMDGNGRWAKARGMPRTLGHKAGVEAVRRTVKAAPNFGINYLTLYAFSSENWSRPPAEVRDLLGLLRLYIRRDLADLVANGVRVRVIGDRTNLTPDIVSLIETAESRTRANTKLNLNIAFNYGGRDELARAVDALLKERLNEADGGQKAAITQADIHRHLDTSAIPDPDLIIRTSGEQRLSNFLLWQAAYSEFVFCDCLWPDFDAQELGACLLEYAQRDRRFGGVDPVPASEAAQ